MSKNYEPAYPIPDFSATQHFGMTLRDYFAAAALQGILAHASPRGERGAAYTAYAYADAMLKHRKSSEEEDEGIYCDVCGIAWPSDAPCPYH